MDITDIAAQIETTGAHPVSSIKTRPPSSSGRTPQTRSADVSATEYGVFNDEGILEQDMWSRDEALATLAARYPDDPHVYVGEVCGDCRASEHSLDGCEGCVDND